MDDEWHEACTNPVAEPPASAIKSGEHETAQPIAMPSASASTADEHETSAQPVATPPATHRYAASDASTADEHATSAQHAAIKRVLAVLTSAQTFSKDGSPTGLWLGELNAFDNVLLAAGHQVSIDPQSVTWMIRQIESATKARLKDEAYLQTLEHTRSIADVDASGYDAIYLLGGHGTMFDFRESQQLQHMLRTFFESGRIVATVCHGCCSLVDV
ncbi:class I glutamine amidotransferase-like protein [Pavlovales sp. CCMP2436]|nr:class I glutamine amidotransferase-like protein [Pavlovales sp. CCMP2436]